MQASCKLFSGFGHSCNFSHTHGFHPRRFAGLSVAFDLAGTRSGCFSPADIELARGHSELERLILAVAFASFPSPACETLTTVHAGMPWQGPRTSHNLKTQQSVDQSTWTVQMSCIVSWNTAPLHFSGNACHGCESIFSRFHHAGRLV